MSGLKIFLSNPDNHTKLLEGKIIKELTDGVDVDLKISFLTATFGGVLSDCEYLLISPLDTGIPMLNSFRDITIPQYNTISEWNKTLPKDKQFDNIYSIIDFNSGDIIVRRVANLFSRLTDNKELRMEGDKIKFFEHIGRDVVVNKGIEDEKKTTPVNKIVQQCKQIVQECENLPIITHTPMLAASMFLV